MVAWGQSGQGQGIQDRNSSDEKSITRSRQILLDKKSHKLNSIVGYESAIKVCPASVAAEFIRARFTQDTINLLALTLS
jgi:hypothetical protein